MGGTFRVVTAGAVLAAGLLAAGVAGAAPALAMNPCDADNPPSYCYDQPPPPPPTPPAPTNLVTSSVLQTSVTLQWTDNASTETSYVIRRSPSGMSSTVLTAPANSAGFTDTGAPANHYLDYYVSAQRCDGDTGLCSTSAAAHVVARTHEQPADPTGSVTENLWGSTYYWSGWAADWDTTAPIQVGLYADGALVSTTTASGTSGNLNATYPGYGDNHGFDVYATKSPAKGTHTFCLRAFNAGGGTDHDLLCRTYVTPGPPSAASNLKLTDTGTSVVVRFVDNANDETGFWLQRSTDGGASWLSVGSQYAPVSGTGGAGSATDYSSPPAGTQYRILMINSYGNTPSAAVTL
ncbi:MAG TPA: hypothetical protein VMB79_18735 [Jatrophihabitans sp.]|nr:hypothetical protein [Jatrophihabitans sp.]